MQPLGLESVELVDRLVGDVIMATESCRDLEKKMNKQQQQLALLQGQMMPLRGENSR